MSTDAASESAQETDSAETEGDRPAPSSSDETQSSGQTTAEGVNRAAASNREFGSGRPTQQTATHVQRRAPGGAPGYVDYDSGPNHQELASRYGVEFVKNGQAGKIQRLESEFGNARVHRWVQEGMTIGTMGKPQDMQAFRKRQEGRPEAVPTDIERRNEASTQRNAAQSREDGPAGETQASDLLRRVVASPGQSLDESVQREMESKMDDDFSDVRIHADSQAAAAAESINARAFTVGNHVAFNRGEYSPDTDSGTKVLAHELTHVRQETDGAVSLLPKADADHPALSPEFSVQPKLEVSSPGDPAEKEAERVADQVMQMDDSPAESAGAEVSDTDREAAETSTETGTEEIGRQQDEVDIAQTAPVARDATSGGDVSGNSESTVRSAVQGGGKPLPSETRSEMESKMGADFSNVNVHTGSDADQAAKSINAKAYTMGSDIAFSKEGYNPDSNSGKKLLAHELTHVVQQGGAQRKADETLSRSIDIRQSERAARIHRMPDPALCQPGGAAYDFYGMASIYNLSAPELEPDEGDEGGNGFELPWPFPDAFMEMSLDDLVEFIQDASSLDGSSLDNLGDFKNADGELDESVQDLIDNLEQDGLMDTISNVDELTGERMQELGDQAADAGDRVETSNILDDVEKGKGAGDIIEPDFNVQLIPPLIEAGLSATLFSAEIELFDKEFQIGSTPFVAGVGADAQASAYTGAWGALDFGKALPLPGQVTSSLSFSTGLTGGLTGRVRGGVGGANLASMGIEGGLGGELEASSSFGPQGTAELDKGSNGPVLTGIEFAGVTSNFGITFEVSLSVGPYVTLVGQKWDWPVDVGRWDFDLVDIQTRFGTISIDDSGVEIGTFDMSINDNEIQGPEFDVGNPVGALESLLGDVEDEKARAMIDELRSEGLLDEMTSERRAELIGMLNRGWFWDSEFETMFVDVLASEPPGDPTRYVLVEAYKQQQGELPETGEDIYDWVNSNVSNDWFGSGRQWDDITAQVGGDSPANFMPTGFRNAEAAGDEDHPIFQKYASDYIDMGGMEAENESLMESVGSALGF